MSDRVTRPTLLGAAGLILCLAAAPEARAQVDSSRTVDSTQVGDSTGVVPQLPLQAATPARSAAQVSTRVQGSPAPRFACSTFTCRPL